MGIGVSLAFIALGAILAFALRVDLSGVNIQMVGWILILVGVISMIFTLMYTRPRRRAGQMAGADPGYVDEPAGPVIREEPTERIVREERVIEHTTGEPVERVERVVERPVSSDPPPHGHASQDPSVAQNPTVAQDPAHENRTSVTSEHPRIPRDR